MARKPSKPKDTPATAADQSGDQVAEQAGADVSTDAGEQNGDMQQGRPPGPMLRILAQYTKDQSFENPNAPDSLRTDKPAPEVAIDIEIGRQMFDDDTVEVTLMLKAQARREDGVAFIAELEYAGLFGFAQVSVEEIQPLILIECPRLLFPFARQIMASMTQNGGYPPILLEPPDFAAMFRTEMQRRAASMNADGAMGEPQGNA